MSDEITAINIDGQRIGLIGLSDIFINLKAMNLIDDSEISQQLIEQVKIQNYVPDSRIDDYAQALLREYKKFAGLPVEPVVEKSAFPTIRILGPGCRACETMEKDVRAILSELNIAADVDHVRDVNLISEYGMIRTPGLVINNQVVLSGRSLPRSQLKKLIQEKLK
jgi:small redox-active disulfide protein 2